MSAMRCVEVKSKLIGLLVDRVLTCDSAEADLAASYDNDNDDDDGDDDDASSTPSLLKPKAVPALGRRKLVVVDQYKGSIVSITDWSDTQESDRQEHLEELHEFPAGATLMPGFIDSHVHLTIETDDYQLDHLRLSSADKSLRALRFAQGLLQAGFTTIRSAGDADKF